MVMVKHLKPHISQRKTLLAVGEGKGDAAFLRHLRVLYCSDGNGVHVTVRSANGKGPGNVISTAIGILRTQSYDKKLCLLDTDIDWTNQNKTDAKRKRIELVGSTPCLEGLLLEILGRPTQDRSEKCKQQLRVITGKDMFEAEDYIENFQFAHLQNARRNIAELDKLLRLFEGK
jgi:hypothetical protein